MFADIRARNAQQHRVLEHALKDFPDKKLAVWAIVINFVCALLCQHAWLHVPSAPCARANSLAMRSRKVQATNAKPPISNERENKKHT